MTRKIILNLAISLDGYICDEDGGFDWIVGQGDESSNMGSVLDFKEFIDTCDTVVFGRKAYEDNPEEGFDMIKDKRLVVVSNSIKSDSRFNTEFISGDIVNKILEIKREQGKNIWLFGGANLTDIFIKSDIIDEYIIGIIPCILGKGRKLFLDNNPTIKLQVQQCGVTDGIIMIRYSKR